MRETDIQKLTEADRAAILDSAETALASRTHKRRRVSFPWSGFHLFAETTSVRVRVTNRAGTEVCTRERARA